MRGLILAAAVATGLGALSGAPAQALGPVPADGASETLATPVSAARERRLYMMRSIQRQQMYGGRGYGRGYGGGYGGGYGRGYGGGYGGGGYGRGYGGGGYGYGGRPRYGYGY